MDLLRTMLANRQSQGMVYDPKPVADKKKPKAEKAKQHTPGSKDMRRFIIEEKPSKKVVREHIQAIIDQECESSSDSD